MPEDIRQLSAQLAQDPSSLVFLRLGELLRRKGQLDLAHRVAITGLERHPHHADAHDLYARILADKHDFERAFDEWDMALRIAPNHIGALKGLAFLYFKIGDVGQAQAHLEEARKVAPDDPSVIQAIELVHGALSPAPDGGPAAVQEPVAETAPAPAVSHPRPPKPPRPPPAPAKEEPQPVIAAAPAPMEQARVFAGLEGAQEGLLLLDGAGRVLGGAVRHPDGSDVTDAVAAFLAGVSQEATRTGKLLALGKWTGLSAEGRAGHVHLSLPANDAMLLVVRDRSVPLGRLAVLAERASEHAKDWLEAQG